MLELELVLLRTEFLGISVVAKEIFPSVGFLPLCSIAMSRESEGEEVGKQVLLPVCK